MYGITNSGKLFADDLTEWLIDAGFIQSQCQMYIYYKYASYGTKLLFYLMLMIVSIGILLNILENSLWISRKDIPFELLVICTLVHFNQNFLDEGSFHLCTSD